MRLSQNGFHKKLEPIRSSSVSGDIQSQKVSVRLTKYFEDKLPRGRKSKT